MRDMVLAPCKKVVKKIGILYKLDENVLLK